MAPSGADEATRSGEPPSTLGMGVHILGLFYSVVGAGIVYLLSSDEFTKTNARNALNWHLFFVAVAALLAAGVLVLGEVSAALGQLFVLAGVLLIALDTVFCIWATYRAVDGVTWRYPIAPEFV